MRARRPLQLLALFAVLAGATLLHANELFSPAPIDEVSVRALPSVTVIEMDLTGTLDASWGKGFRYGARYSASAHSSLNTPTIITFPDWDKSPTAEGNQVHLLVQCMLDPQSDQPRIRDAAAQVRELPRTTFACYAQRGDYSAASFLAGLHKIQERLKAQNLSQVGPPRYLYYTTTSWMPWWWRIGEVQVPIAAGGP